MSKNTNYEWQLPEKEVLNAMWENRESIGGFDSGNYWSSSDDDGSHYAWSQNFGNGNRNFNYKYSSNRVRTVRALPEDHKETDRVFMYNGQEYQAYEKEMNWYDAIIYS